MIKLTLTIIPLITLAACTDSGEMERMKEHYWFVSYNVKYIDSKITSGSGYATFKTKSPFFNNNEMGSQVKSMIYKKYPNSDSIKSIIILNFQEFKSKEQYDIFTH